MTLGVPLGEGVAQLHVGAGVGTGGVIDAVGEGRLDLGGTGLLSATGTLARLSAADGSGAGVRVGEAVAVGFAPLVGNAAGASPRVSNESSPPVTTT
ncbi:hypothetical protein Rhe02_30340 [Rhizocola hellebori]|uniref:Uncharacterized protein n=1 Tax=Rhizocola hellebori TaxID=1392758 RepID=A0A8J3Q7T3_9ACTN|nr:hypothetical protein [Rhizocola hellebori]GIH04967.1 hypothetical protein Rhe02_30340 [Rhizocola hellebori]